jgi:hypothetical protein
VRGGLSKQVGFPEATKGLDDADRFARLDQGTQRFRELPRPGRDGEQELRGRVEREQRGGALPVDLVERLRVLGNSYDDGQTRGGASDLEETPGDG